jgi:hypothetical protein
MGLAALRTAPSSLFARERSAIPWPVIRFPDPLVDIFESNIRFRRFGRRRFT